MFFLRNGWNSSKREWPTAQLLRQGAFYRHNQYPPGELFSKYQVNKLLNCFLTVFSPSNDEFISLVSCFIDICYNSILVIKGLFCFICHIHHLFAKICFTVWFCTLCLFLFAMDMYSFNVVLLIITRCWCTTNLKCEGTLDFG